MDGCSERHVLLIAATNQPWNIDSAVQRAGRLDKKIYVAPPDLTARGEILAHHLNGRYTSPDLDTGMVASSLAEVGQLTESVEQLEVAEQLCPEDEDTHGALERVRTKLLVKT